MPDQNSDIREQMARELATIEATLDSHERRLNAVNGNILRTGIAVEGLTVAFKEDRATALAMAKTVEERAQGLAKALEKIEAGELERAKEARADRKSVKLAIYSFTSAIVASGIGALLLHYA